MLDEANAYALVNALWVTDSVAAPEAIADLKLYSHGRADLASVRHKTESDRGRQVAAAAGASHLQTGQAVLEFH